MKKRGGLLLIIGIVILVLLIGIIGAGFYFYNVHVFKTVRVCIGDAINTTVPCGVTQDCVDIDKIAELGIDLDNIPDFVRDNFQKILDEVVYCDKSCFVKNIRGVNWETQELEMLDSCKDEEVEFLIEIRGKEALAIWKWMRLVNSE